jgi:hypothetical protein
VCDAPNRLVLTMESGTEDDVLYKHGAGWQAHVEDLCRYLAGGQSMWKARWEELSPAYQSLDLSWSPGPSVVTFNRMP